jgi:hypothetical protein
MIEFIQFGPHKLEKNKQPEIEEALSYCNSLESSYSWLNMIYNNQNHFFNPSYSYDILKFLEEIVMIADSPTDKLIVMGSIHEDTGHQSGLVLYQKTKKESVNTFLSDSYIRFTIKLQSHKKLSVLNETEVFHFLVDVPKVLWVPGNVKKGNILLFNIPPMFDDQTAHMYYPKLENNFKIIRM